MTKKSKKKKKDYNKEKRLLKKKLDNLCREYNKLKYDKCVTCGSVEDLQWGHLLTSRSLSTRWDEKNYARQCSGCNLRHEHKPEYFIQWYLRTNGLFSWDNLVRRHHEVMVWNKKALEAEIERYKNLIENYGK